MSNGDLKPNPTQPANRRWGQGMTRRHGHERRPTQTARLVALLRDRSPDWVSLPEILNLRISQYGARLYQARHEWGLKIENRVEIIGGKKHSWFRLESIPPEVRTAQDLKGLTVATPIAFPEFGSLAPESYGVD